MVAKILVIFSALVYVNCQYILPGGPPCGCNSPLISPSCGCNLAAQTAGLPAALAQLLLQKAPVTASKSCGCNAALPIYERMLAPAPLPVVQEYVVNSPLAMSSPCGCASSPCSCSGLCKCNSAVPVGCTNPFLPAASPVSAMAPQVVSSVLPPVCPCENKCLYLRKIPIPPPAL